MGEVLKLESKNKLKAMANLLEQEAGYYANLLDLARCKQKVLVGGQFAELESLLVEEQEFLKEVASLEEERYALQCDLAKEFGKHPTDVTVSKLSDLAEPEIGSILKENQQRLVHLLHELTAVNRCNSELIQQSLSYINFTMETLASGIGGSAPTYNGTGSRKRSKSVSRFLNRSI